MGKCQCDGQEHTGREAQDCLLLLECIVFFDVIRYFQPKMSLSEALQLKLYKQDLSRGNYFVINAPVFFLMS